ncbi:MAG: polymer-forming cytoskeletal protein [Thermodesulfobacteriota bacterium]|nr:polymer-forming cytoskeletal protein [Thermodesulfobacteriota bacterium]
MGKSKRSESITTFLGSDASVEGVINFDGTIRLDGQVSGRITSNGGTVIIGEKAVIDGDIAVGIAIIKGRVKGMIDAGDRIEVYPPADIEGDIHAPVISIDAGVKFNGNCAMKSRNGLPVQNLGEWDADSEKIGDNVKNFPKNL